MEDLMNKKTKLFIILLISLATLVLEPIVIVNFLNENNWSYLIIIKLISNLVCGILIGLIAIIFLRSQEKQIARKILPSILITFLSIYLFLGAFNSYKDFSTGIKSFNGNCTVRVNRSIYILDRYYITTTENSNLNITVDLSTFNNIIGESKGNQDTYTCKGDIDITYLENLGVMINSYI